MAKFLNKKNTNKPKKPEYFLEPDSKDFSVPDYKNDEDFDEAFKHLLLPIEFFLKTNNIEHHQCDLLKELDSYLNHLKVSSDESSSVFVEAALMLQNVTLIYHKKVDQIVDDMTKLVGKFQSYRTNTNKIDEATEKVEGNKKKKIEKKKKFYSSFEPIEIQLYNPLHKFDCKDINLSTLPPIPKIVLNTNIKVTNKYNTALPYINIGNGVNIGKKYDFIINLPLNRDLALSEEFYRPINGDHKSTNSINYVKSTDLVSMNLMDVDDANTNGTDLSTSDPPDPVIFNQTLINEVCSANAVLRLPPKILDISQIHDKNVYNNESWFCVEKKTDDLYYDKPTVKKKHVEKEKSDVFYIPSYTYDGSHSQSLKLNLELIIAVYLGPHLPLEDLTFKHYVCKTQKNHTVKIQKKCSLDGVKETEEQLNNDPEPDVEDDFPTCQKNDVDTRRQDVDNQMEIIDEQLDMNKRVEAWHNNLRLILKEEEKRTEFDVHLYGTHILNCFSHVGEVRSFKELVQGMNRIEVPRYFLSVLMMANTSNLKIINSNGEIFITLLKKERHHEELQVNIGNQINQD